MGQVTARRRTQAVRTGLSGMFYSWHAKSEGATLVCVLEVVTGGILGLPALANCTYSCSSEYFNFCQSLKIIK